ncbi:MAG: DMT family transporter [Bacteroidales bacterium]|nr:DMT family transporter [Bacteroidales bacterium]MDD4685461.1 DMT family transporter [Bacteroidales bacterium]
MKDVSKGHIAILVVNIIFGLNIPIAKEVLSNGAIAPLALTYFRVVGAALVFWFASMFVKSEKLTKKDFFILFLGSIFAISLNQTSFIVGLQTTTPIDASLIITLTPIITMLISAAYLKEPITTKKLIGVLVGLSGALILIVNSEAFKVGGSGSWTGNMLCLLSSTSYAAYLVFFRDFIKTKHPITIMKWMFLFSMVILAPITLPTALETDVSRITPIIYSQIFYVVVMSTFLTYLLIPIGQKNLRPTTLTMYNYLQPIIAAVVAIVMVQDKFGLDKILSAVLVFLGVYIVTKSKSRQQLDEEKLRKQNNNLEKTK